MKTIKNILLALLGGLIFLGAMLVGTQANAQGAYLPSLSWDGTHIYAPQYTKHFKGNEYFAVKANGSEGGSEGFLITRSSKGLHFTLGKMENSYGDFSTYGMFGITLKENNRFQLSAHIGYADNYNKAYFNKKNSKMLYKLLPESMARHSYIPVASLTYKYRITRGLGVQVNVSPAFVNTGIYIQL